MSAHTVGVIADHIDRNIPSGYITYFANLGLNTDFTFMSGHVCTIRPIDMVVASPPVIDRTITLAGGRTYDPTDIPGVIYAPLGMMMFTQGFKLSGTATAVAGTLGYLSGMVGLYARLYFTGATTDANYPEYGPKSCRAVMLPHSSLANRNLNRTTSTQTYTDITLVWRQKSAFQPWTP